MIVKLGDFVQGGSGDNYGRRDITKTECLTLLDRYETVAERRILTNEQLDVLYNWDKDSNLGKTLSDIYKNHFINDLDATILRGIGISNGLNILRPFERELCLCLRFRNSFISNTEILTFMFFTSELEEDERLTINIE